MNHKKWAKLTFRPLKQKSQQGIWIWRGPTHKHGGHGCPGCVDHQCDDKCICCEEGEDPPETLVVRWPPIESFTSTAEGLLSFSPGDAWWWWWLREECVWQRQCWVWESYNDAALNHGNANLEIDQIVQQCLGSLSSVNIQCTINGILWIPLTPWPTME